MINKLYKKALITGSAEGIGYSILTKLLKNNIEVIAVDKNKEKLKKISKDFKNYKIDTLANQSLQSPHAHEFYMIRLYMNSI